MKHIRKRSRPRALYHWHLANTRVPDAQYGTHNFPTAAVHSALLEEQGGICAYTMIRIDAATSHIEHLKPQTLSRADGKLWETSDYDNIVACYPQRHRRGDPPVTFGAIFRNDTYDARYFITPLSQSCESRIRFGMDGKVRPGRSNDLGACWTIQTLGLGDSKLDALRRAAVEATGLSLASENPVSRREAERIAAHICRRNGDREFHPYCVALKHAAEEYLRVLDRTARRRKYAAVSRRRAQR